MRYLIVLALLIFSFPVWAGEQCYTGDQYHAEQTLRYQTQLMVIAMMCDPHTDEALFTNYQNFTAQNESIITDNENKLLSFYKTNAVKNPNKELHTLRTSVANEIAQYTSGHVPSKFCNKFKNRIDEAITLKPEKLVTLINNLGTDLPSSYPLCVQN